MIMFISEHTRKHFRRICSPSSPRPQHHHHYLPHFSSTTIPEKNLDDGVENEGKKSVFLFFLKSNKSYQSTSVSIFFSQQNFSTQQLTEKSGRTRGKEKRRGKEREKKEENDIKNHDQMYHYTIVQGRARKTLGKAKRRK